MRAFLAINFHKELQEELAGIQNGLRSKIHGVRWVAPQLLHITLKFLGELDDDFLPFLDIPLREIGKNTKPFIVSLARLGAFPSPGNPRVFWIGIKEGASQLNKLATNIEQALDVHQPFFRSNIRNNTGKPFQPHITLGRIKNKGRKWRINKELFEITRVCKNLLPVKSFFLMQSALYPTGPVYTPVREFLFKPGNKQEILPKLQNKQNRQT